MTPQDLKDGICQRLAELWSDRTIYPDVCPDNHERPSAYVQMLESTPTMINAHIVRWDAKLLVVLWGDLDYYSLTNSRDLMRDQKDAILAMFPLLKVGDRVILLSVTDQGQDHGDGSAFVEVTAQWYDGTDLNQESGESNANAPLMRDIYGRVENKKGAEEKWQI